MKRLLWCLCLCALCPTLIIGCGDDEGGGGAEDGGVSQADLEDVNNAIDNITTDLGELTDNVDGLGDKVDGIEGDLSDLTDDVQGRLEDLENPEILSCSESEVCIPDGVDLTREGLADIITAVCEHEIDCCDETELNLKFGPSIESVEDCEELFTDVVENGFSPDIFYNGMTPDVIYQVIGVAQALNDPRVRVEIDPEGVEACVEYLQVECPDIPEPVDPVDPVCPVYHEPGDEYPCSLDSLLNGLQEEGELCGDYSFGEGDDIPECMDGFYCSYEGYSNNEQGLCARLPETGDRCQYDYQCDPYGYGEGWNPKSTQLYCNIGAAECQPLGGVGDDCEFIVDDFSITDEYMYPQNRSATSQDCMNGLTCDPTTNKCVANCQEGRFCSPMPDSFYTCGPDLVCNITAIPELYESWGLGTCAEAIEVGGTCTQGSECESGRCQEDCNLDTMLCECSPEKAPGEECTTPGFDEDCASNWCGTNGECVETCQCDENRAAGDCDANVGEGPAMPTACEDGFYCDFGSYTELSDDNFYSLYACEARIANGNACDTSTSSPHASCASGFCDPGTTLCAPKVAMDAACPSNVDQQCRSNQYCNANSLCRTYVAAGASCDLADASGLRCARGLECVDGATDTCQPPAESGEECDDDNIGAPRCNYDENPYFVCVDIDDQASGSERRCYSTQGGFADNVYCYGSDSYCASGWCRPDAAVSPTTSACAQPLEEGDECDLSSGHRLDVCGDGLFCEYVEGTTAGTCAPMQGPGGPCKPYLQGTDCVGDGSCVFTKDQYLCNEYSIDYETERFCGAN